MKSQTKIQAEWLAENNVHVYRGYFEYRGFMFETVHACTGFYCVDLTNQITYPKFNVKTTAIYWACKLTDSKII